MKRILALASGRGSNFQALCDASKKGILRADIVGLGVSRLGTGAAQIAMSAGIPVLIQPSDQAIIDFFREERVDALVLAGYMKILSSELIEALRGKDGHSRIVNIHPSLLPAFPGMNAYWQAYNAGVPETGVTVHLVEREVDTGPVLDQKSFRIDDLRSVEEVEARGLEIEHGLYARAIDRFINEGKLDVTRTH